MNKDKVKQIVAEEVKRQRKRLFQEQNNPLEPNDQPQQDQQQQQAPQQSAPEPTNAGPGLNPKKAKGIIAGAIKTLINSGALQGISPEQVDAITTDVIKNLDTSVKATGGASEPTDDSEEDNPEFDDATSYEEEENELDDQNQYDPDLDKQIKDDDEEAVAPEAPAEEEPLFEAKDLKSIFN